MIPSHRTPTHPGEVLQEEFLTPLGVTQVALAEHIRVSVQRVNELVRGKRGVTPDTAWLLAQAFDTTPEFWLNLQATFDLAQSRPPRAVRRLRKAGQRDGPANARERDGPAGHGACKLRTRRARPARALRGALGALEMLCG
ncbi:MAG: HigA family addiction module antidote protein [Acidobacteriia bacterium]|nr:HigA family addiction module antidote protein [Terriglobia bacterium]